MSGSMLFSLILLTCVPCCIISSSANDQLLVNMTLVQNASAIGAYCLDGSLPAYHLHRGSAAGASNWLLQFEGGGWCNSVASCLDRAKTHRGSTLYMDQMEPFSGILSNNATRNPDFYNWNRVKIRYCDGASFAGNSIFDNGTSLLYYRGQRIWEAIILDLLPKGLSNAKKALLGGCSAGGLAVFLHCDNFATYLPTNTSVKCFSDAGFFLDARDIMLNNTMRAFYKNLTSLQGVVDNMDKNCTKSEYYPEQCIFPQYALPYIKTPVFILNTAYDVYQFHHILVPTSADPHGVWNHCKINPAECSPNQIDILQGFRLEMLNALRFFIEYSRRGGLFINSCFAHCQSESEDTWSGADSPRVNNKTIAEAVGDWYFGRRDTMEIDCAYPCDNTCHNLIGLRSSFRHYNGTSRFKHLT